MYNTNSGWRKKDDDSLLSLREDKFTKLEVEKVFPMLISNHLLDKEKFPSLEDWLWKSCGLIFFDYSNQ